jgi:hypothetical protein
MGSLKDSGGVTDFRVTISLRQGQRRGAARFLPAKWKCTT